MFPQFDISHLHSDTIDPLLKEIEQQEAIRLEEIALVRSKKLVIVQLTRTKLMELLYSFARREASTTFSPAFIHKKKSEETRKTRESFDSKDEEWDIESILAKPTFKERSNQNLTSEILQLLQQPTVRELSARNRVF